MHNSESPSPETDKQKKASLDMAESAVDLEQSTVQICATKTQDGDRSLVQDETRRDDNLKDRFIGAIDQGTTSTRFIIFDCTGIPVASHQTEFRQIHEKSG